MAITRSANAVEIVESETGRGIATLHAPAPQVTDDLRFSPDGRYLAASSRRDSAIHLWDLVALRRALKARRFDLPIRSLPARDSEPPVRLALVGIPAEAEASDIREADRCTPEVQALAPRGEASWSGGRQLLCTGEVGGSVTLALDVAIAGRYRIGAWMTRANDYGMVSFTLDGQRVGPRFDGYAPSVTAPERVDLGTADLGEGAHLLRFQCTGRNAASSGTLIGVDCIDLEPLRR